MSNSPAGVPNRSMIAAVLAAIGASTCCAGPLILLTLGVSGSWIGNLSSVEPYRPLLIGITLVFLGLAFRKLYLVPRSCAVGSVCAIAATLRKQRITFWVVTAVVLAIVSFPWYGLYILD